MPYYCYHCNQPRADCPEGPKPGSCAKVEATAAEYRQELADGKYKTPLMNLTRLKSDNAAHTTQHALHRETIDIAKREGREEQLGAYRH